MKIKIYQVNIDRDKFGMSFACYGLLKEKGIALDPSIYDLAFDGEIEGQDLEDVFDVFNTSRPQGFVGRSLGVSDVVETFGDVYPAGRWYRDAVGWVNVSDEFQTEKPLPIYERYILEPRTGWRSSGSRWLVVLDTVTGQYLCEPGTKRYLRFSNSKQAFDYIQKEVRKDEGL